MNPTTRLSAGAREYARLLLRLHELDPRGAVESPELDAICDQMDRPWVQMNGREKSLVKGLSIDLYALADGRQGVSMSPEEQGRWADRAKALLAPESLSENVETALQFLREPYPDGLPAFTIPFFQAKIWELLGEDDVALTFMKEAERLDPHQAVGVLSILLELGRDEEAALCAERIAGNTQSSAEELYQAASALLLQARIRKTPEEATPTLVRITSTLERSLHLVDQVADDQIVIPHLDRYIISLLGYCQNALGKTSKAVRWYSEGLTRYPGDADLLSLRAYALIDSDLAKALDDCRRAVQAGARSIWPYYFLAWDAIRRFDHSESWRLCLRALEQPGGPDGAKARLHEWLAISQAELGQPIGHVLDSLRRAESLDPENPRIRANRMHAEKIAKSEKAGSADGWTIEGHVSGQQAIQEAYFTSVIYIREQLGKRSEKTLATYLRSA